MRSLKPLLGVALLGATMLVAGCGRTNLDFVGGVGGGDGEVASGGRTGTGGGGGPLGTGGVSGSGGLTSTGGVKGSGGSGAAAGADGGITDAALDLKTTDAPPADVTAPDAGRLDAQGPDLPPPTPGTLPCGNESCDTRTQSCCVSIAIGAVGARCIPAGASCGGIPLACDEPADCSSGTCCFGLQAQQGAGSALAVGSVCSTRAACNGAGRYVVCRTNGDCDRATPLCCFSALGVPLCQRVCP